MTITRQGATRLATRSAASLATTGILVGLMGSPASARGVAAQDYVVRPGDTVSAIALTYGTSVAEIVARNGLDTRATIIVGQRLDLPEAGLASPAAAGPSTHTVVAGDTLWDIARTYGTTVAALQQANGLIGSSVIVLGRTLALPAGAAQTAAAAPSAAPAASTYVVRAGDTAWAIAARAGISLDALVAASGLTNPSLVRIGQVLTLPAGAAALPTAPGAPATQTPTSATYVVVAGDTVSRIASRHGTTVAAIANANGLADASLITIGQVLTIPGVSSAPLVGSTFLGRTYPADVVAAANANKATLNAMTVPSKAEMKQLVIDTAVAMGVDPALALAVAHQESGFSARAVSPANAIGCMQVIPASGEWASDLVGRDLDLLDPYDNVTAGVAILRQLLRNGTALETAIAGYYQGERSVRERGFNPDTEDYVASVVALMERYR